MRPKRSSTLSIKNRTFSGSVASASTAKQSTPNACTERKVVCAAIEVVDDRSADYSSLDVRSLVADNSWNAGIVLSEFATRWPDLEAVVGRATKDDAAIGEGHGRDILGHPFNSVAWLATQLGLRGVNLRAGQIVMTGSVMKTVFPVEDASYRFEFEEIGFVEVQVR